MLNPNRLAERYRLTRIVLIGILMLVALVLLSWYRSAPPSAFQTVAGTVVEIGQGEAQSWKTQGTVRFVTALVELDDGTRTRVMVLGNPPNAGERVALIEELRGDGSRHFRHDARHAGLH